MLFDEFLGAIVTERSNVHGPYLGPVRLKRIAIVQEQNRQCPALGPYGVMGGSTKVG